MPGIDLVDLNDPLLRKRDQKALRLILHPKDSFPAHLGFWYLWTAKEAIFKHHRELTNFAPKEIPVAITEQNGKASFVSNELVGQFKIVKGIIIAICSELNEDVDFHFFQGGSRHQSKEIRSKVENYLLQKYHIKTIISSDGNGLPIIDFTGQSISFTHHFHYLAFAFDRNLLKANNSTSVKPTRPDLRGSTRSFE